MRFCHFCNGEVVLRAHPDNPDQFYEFPNHRACEEEVRRREDSGKCIGCGKADAVEERKWCPTCYRMDELQWSGYPPGGS